MGSDNWPVSHIKNRCLKMINHHCDLHKTQWCLWTAEHSLLMTKNVLRRINTDKPSASCLRKTHCNVSIMINRQSTSIIIKVACQNDKSLTDSCSGLSSKERIDLIIFGDRTRLLSNNRIPEIHLKARWTTLFVSWMLRKLRLFLPMRITCCWIHGSVELHRTREIRPARSNTFSDHSIAQREQESSR